MTSLLTAALSGTGVVSAKNDPPAWGRSGKEKETASTDWIILDEFDGGVFADGWEETNAWETTEAVASTGTYSAFTNTRWSRLRWVGEPDFSRGTTLAFDFAFSKASDQQLNCYFGCNEADGNDESYRLQIQRDSIGLMDTDGWSWLRGNDSYRNTTIQEFQTVELTFIDDTIEVVVTGETDAKLSVQDATYNGGAIHFDIDMGGAYLDNVRVIEDGGDTHDSNESDADTSRTPLERHGQLSVHGTELCNEAGEPVQLTGMSSHGLQWFGLGDCLTDESLDVLAADWKSDLLRTAMYVQSDGYETDPDGFTAEVNTLVEKAAERGMYALVDFHVLNPGDPMKNVENAKTFFDDIAREHADKDNVIYEICNEPNGEDVDWARIKEYADEVIPVIRAHDPDGVIVVGTRGWSSLGFADIGPDGPKEILNDPVDDENVMYAYHFYAATHGEWERDQLSQAADELPLFVTEWGSMEADGDGESDFDSARAFVDVMSENNISWAFWNYSDDWRTSGIWQEGTADEKSWTSDNLTGTGIWIRDQIKNS